jgi:hypothetical protein
MNTKNSTFFPLLKPFIDLDSLVLDQLEDQVPSGREIRISSSKTESPAPRLTNPFNLKALSPSNSDSRNILVDNFEPFPLVTSNGLTVKGNQYHKYPNSHHGDDEVEADVFPMFDPQKLQQATPQGPTTVTALTSLSNTFFYIVIPLPPKPFISILTVIYYPQIQAGLTVITVVTPSLHPPGVWMPITQPLVM